MTQPATSPALIPRKVLFANPDHVQVRLSPDGQWVAYLAPRESKALNIWIRPADGSKEARPLTSVHRNIPQHMWAFDNRHVLYIADDNGDENYRLYKVDIHTAKVTTLVDFENTMTLPLAVSPTRPKEIAIGRNDRDQRWHDVYIINIETDVSTLVYKNVDDLGMATACFDNDLRLRLASKARPDGGREYVKRDLATGIAHSNNK